MPSSFDQVWTPESPACELAQRENQGSTIDPNRSRHSHPETPCTRPPGEPMARRVLPPSSAADCSSLKPFQEIVDELAHLKGIFPSPDIAWAMMRRVAESEHHAA